MCVCVCVSGGQQVAVNEWLNSRAVTIADTFRALFVLVWTFDGGTSETGFTVCEKLEPAPRDRNRCQGRRCQQIGNTATVEARPQPGLGTSVCQQGKKRKGKKGGGSFLRIHPQPPITLTSPSPPNSWKDGQKADYFLFFYLTTIL